MLKIMKIVWQIYNSMKAGDIMKYIALLRGINISGKDKISMIELKLELEKNNYQNVSTYLNSGNVIFESDIDNKDSIIERY